MLKLCKNGHQFEKSSDCPICPVCDKIRQETEVVFASLSAPAQRALINNDIFSLLELAKFSESQVLEFHGLGKSSIPKLTKLLKDAGLKFKEL